MSIRPIPVVLHTVALHTLASGYYSLITMQTATDDWIRSQKGEYWQFLTVQALLIACGTMLLSLLADLLPKIQPIVRAKRLTTMMALPLAAVVSSIYWGLILFAPSLILPPAKSVDGETAVSLAFIPLHVDLAVHLCPAVFLILDFYLLEEKFSSKDVKLYAPLMSLLYGFFYAGWVEYLNTFNNRFPYPFLNVEFQYRAQIYLGTVAFAYTSFRQLNFLHPGKPILGSVIQNVIEPGRDYKAI